MPKKLTSRTTRADKKADRYLSHKDVPYLDERSGVDVNRYLPSRARDHLTAARVGQFVEDTHSEPDTRLAVLGILRSHASNGAEVPLSAFALMASVIAILAASTNDLPYFGWIIGILFVGAAATVLRMSVAAHIRRITALVWLGAYEDALGSGSASDSRFRWRRR
jgi:hypothetical protein